MELILKETINTLGQIGDVVTVKDGYGRNYLLPQGKAVLATKASLEELEKNKAEIAAKVAEETKIAEGIGKKISGNTITIEQLAGDDGRLFGSVTTADIAEKICALGIEIDKRQVVLTDPIKAVGEYEVEIKVGYSVTAEVKVVVVAAGKE